MCTISTPDYQKWSRREQWTLIEAASILAGFEPVFGISNPHRVLAAIADPTQRDLFNELYAQSKDARGKSLRISERSRTGEIGNKRTKPEDYLAWASARGFQVPPDLAPLMDAPQRDARIVQQLAAEKAKGNRKFLKTVAEGEGLSISRVKQIRDKARSESAS
jgi:hypothetical protein